MKENKITDKFESLFEFYNLIKVTSFEAGYKFDIVKELLEMESKKTDTVIKKKSVKIQPEKKKAKVVKSVAKKKPMAKKTPYKKKKTIKKKKTDTIYI